VAIALTAERDVAGVPCGNLDQRAIVHARPAEVLALDCAGRCAAPCALAVAGRRADGGGQR